MFSERVRSGGQSRTGPIASDEDRRRMSASGTAAAEISISVQKTSTLAILRQRDTRIADLVCADAADFAGRSTSRWCIKPWRASDQA